MYGRTNRPHFLNVRRIPEAVPFLQQGKFAEIYMESDIYSQIAKYT